MLANCARFIERRCEAGGWKSYAELERELAQSKTALRNFVNAIEDYKETGVWPDNCTLRRLADEGMEALSKP
jgi:hypothetical protein